MFTRFEYQIPANTSEVNRITQHVPISYGILRRIKVAFPAGCGKYDVGTDTTYHLARCRVLCQTTQVVPRDPAYFLGADDHVVDTDDLFYPILEGEPVLDWELWNLDDTYPHRLWISVAWQTKEELDAELEQLKEANLRLEDLATLLRSAFRI